MERRNKGSYPFGVFHTSLESTLCTESELKNDLSLETVSSSVIMGDEILLERLSDLLLGDYSVFFVSFNFLLYFLSACLGNARTFLQKCHGNHFFLHLYWMLVSKSLRPIVELCLSLLLLSLPVSSFLLLSHVHNRNINVV